MTNNFIIQIMKNVKKSLIASVFVLSTIGKVHAQNTNDIFKHIDKIYFSDSATLKGSVIDTIQGEGGYSISYESTIKISGFETTINEEFIPGEKPYYITICYGAENNDYSSVFEGLKKLLVSRYKKLKLDDSNQSNTNHYVYDDLKRVLSLNDQEGNEVILLKLWTDGVMQIQIRRYLN